MNNVRAGLANTPRYSLISGLGCGETLKRLICIRQLLIIFRVACILVGSKLSIVDPVDTSCIA